MTSMRKAVAVWFLELAQWLWPAGDPKVQRAIIDLGKAMEQ